jgi:UDP-N-acetylglucosamine--N-acetylmuramyl-(pentapeptide) pyrophosphoryl-undecaprenol N-acetylglucosamine transferase
VSAEGKLMSFQEKRITTLKKSLQRHNHKNIKKRQPYRVIISGGGTGGHVYPAIAIANKMKELYPDTKFLFVGAKGKMEMEKVPDAGYDIKGLWISGLQRKLTLKNLLFPFKLVSSMLSTRKIIKKFKPDVVIGVGGFASGPTLKTAARLRIPTLIQEQNSYAGLTNRLLAKNAHRICVAYERMDQFFPKEKVVFTGNPVRNDIIDIDSKREEALSFFGLSTRKKTIFCFGGSLGARTLNDSIYANLDVLMAADVQLIWQIGSIYFTEFEELLKKMSLKGIRYFEFLREMDLGYAAADVVISRAGALSISEICLTAKPAIFVPSPNVAEDHQTKNATALVNAGAALLVKDSVAKQTLVSDALRLICDEKLKKDLSENITAFARPQAAEAIVKEIVSIAR